jgi:acetyltransferase-like isoleucine patch superfamily enzyme
MFRWIGKKAIRWLNRELEWLHLDMRDVPFAARGVGVRICDHCRFLCAENIHLGRYIYIGALCYFAGHGGIDVGDNVAIGPSTTIWSANHNYDQAEYVPFDDMVVGKQVTIESHVWIGGNVVILPGVTVHEGAVVGAGAVVTKEVPRCAIVGGNPARVIKYRDTEHFEQLVKEGKWFERLEWERQEGG